MIRTDADLVAAFVIDFHPYRDYFPRKDFISGTVHKAIQFADSDLTVASTVLGSHPEPAMTAIEDRGIVIDLAHDDKPLL
jgi:hypothetical protein